MDNPPAIRGVINNLLAIKKVINNLFIKYTNLIYWQGQNILKKGYKINKGKEWPRYTFYIPL